MTGVELEVWTRFAAAVMPVGAATNPQRDAKWCAKHADAMLNEWRKRAVSCMHGSMMTEKGKDG